MFTEQLDVIGITNGGNLLKAHLGISDGTGKWQPWAMLEVDGVSDIGPLNSIDSVAGIADPLDICVTTANGRLLISSFNSETEKWSPFQDLQPIIGGNWSIFQQVSIEQVHIDLHLCVLALAADAQPHILHSVRHQNGSWDPWQDITQDGQAGFPGSFVAIDCATGTIANQLLHICAVSSDGGLWHTALSDKNQWSPFEDVKALSANNPGAFTDVRIASTLDKLHVCAVLAGDLWHTMQFSDPVRWQGAFDNVKEGASDPGSIFSIDCAAEDVKLHVCVVTEDGELWQTMRFEDPDGWVPFDDVTSIIGDGTVFLYIISAIAQIFVLMERGRCPYAVQSSMANNCYRIGRRDPQSGALRANNQVLHANNPECDMPC